MTPAAFHPACAQIRLAGARAAFFGPPLNLAPHRVAVATLAICPEGELQVDLGNGWQTRPMVLIPPGHRHQLRASRPTLFLYLDPLGDDHAAIAARFDAWPAPPHVDTDDWTLAELCARLGLARRPPADRRIAALLARLDVAPDAFPDLAAAARLTGLSPMRCRLLIRQATGVRFSRYRLWRRLALAVRLAAEGLNLTEAAHGAGFASSAHFSSSFRAMFGLTPSALLALRPCIVDETANPLSRAAPLPSAPYSL